MSNIHYIYPDSVPPSSTPTPLSYSTVTMISSPLTGLPKTTISDQIPSDEKDLLNTLHKFRHSLNKWKRESHNNVTLADINHHCVELGKMMQCLREVREKRGGLPGDPNRLDVVLDSVWGTLFNLWGKVASVDEKLYPTYTHLIAISRKLDEYKRTGAFTIEDVTAYQLRVAQIENKNVIDGKFISPRAAADPDTPSPPVVLGGQAVLMGLLNRIHRTLEYLLGIADSVAPEMQTIYAKLMETSKTLQKYEHSKTYTLDSLYPIQTNLTEIDSLRVNGSFVLKDGSIPAGQAALIGLLDSCFETLHRLVSSKDEVTGPLRPLYEELSKIHADLESVLVSDRRWEVTAADLEPMQARLVEIDRSSVNGIFYGESTGEIPAGQAVIHYLLHQCFNLIHAMLSDATPVSDALSGIYELLVTCRDRLRESRKIFVRQQKLDEIQPELDAIAGILKTLEDSKRNGVFYGTEFLSADTEMFQEDSSYPASMEIPEGQAILSSLLSECYERLRELRVVLLWNSTTDAPPVASEI
ncbi:uncharacterized protein BJ171DRAFT_454098 [Polychytrium aggregatum]|uniref:uncharacterized protein n=1 Tax=Polychytrium aggregatum TaxID=110093 RepID=UPI0022FE8C96|nr:uncharacterized protein BJ171DRAFT_454098 [Polychytrium aggregatum]KAI9209916.1 hypothetical protein BJ171DRAFT_454098 [Polychytrium aggregatum]